MEWIVRPTALLRRCAATYGEPFTLRTLWSDAPMVLVSSPADVRRVFSAPGSVLGGGGSAVLEPFAGPTSLLVLSGEEHLARRRSMLPAFHGSSLSSYAPMVAALAEAEMASWPRGVPVSSHSRMQALTLEVMLRVVLGARGPEAAALRSAISSALSLVRSPPRLVLMSVLGRDRAFRRAVAAVDDLLYALIRERAGAAREGGSILDSLLSASPPSDSPHPSGLSCLTVGIRGSSRTTSRESAVRDQLVTLLAAGHETTATALAWAFERLSRDPALVSELRAGDEELLSATVKEVLRIRPVLSVAPREVLAPFELSDGRVLPPGVQVAACLYLAHRRAESFPPDPLPFRPRRWIDGPKPPPYAWIPFGGGDRRCLGAAFAEMEMREILRVAVRRWRFGPAGARGERARRRAVSLTPARGGRVVAW